MRYVSTVAGNKSIAYETSRNGFTLRREGSALAALIRQCQLFVTNAVGAAFAPYDIRQIHATIIGLEARIASPAYNANFARHRGRDVVMDFDGFFAYLRECGQIPFEYFDLDGRPVNPLAYAFAGSNPALPTNLKSPN
jgi:hypothetical protein